MRVGNSCRAITAIVLFLHVFGATHAWPQPASSAPAGRTGGPAVVSNTEQSQKLQSGIDYPRIALERLSAPAKLALSIKWKNDDVLSMLRGVDSEAGDDSYSVFTGSRDVSLGIDVALTATRDYHRSESAKYAIRGVHNWLARGRTVNARYQNGGGSSTISIRKPYLGTMSVEGGGESVPTASTAENGQKWKQKNLNCGVKVTQQIPYTDTDLVGCVFSGSERAGLGAIPIILSVYYKRIFAQEKPEVGTSNREGFAADWGMPIVGISEIFSSYLYPHWEVTWDSDQRPVGFISIELSNYIRAAQKVIGTKAVPVFFLRYQDGKKPPEFADVHGWVIGAGVTVLWGYGGL